MPTSRIRCTVVEITGDQSAGHDSLVSGEKELLPWADPFIAQLVARYRVRAALDDSLKFLQSDALYADCQSHQRPETRRPHGSRFSTPLDDSPTHGDSWPW